MTKQSLLCIFLYHAVTMHRCRGELRAPATHQIYSLLLSVIKRFGRTKAPSGRELSPKVTEGARARRGVVLYCYTRRLLPPHPWSPSLSEGGDARLNGWNKILRQGGTRCRDGVRRKRMDGCEIITNCAAGRANEVRPYDV